MLGVQIDDRATDTPVRRTRPAATSGARPTSLVTVVLMPAYLRVPLPSTTVPAYGATVLAATVVSHGALWSRVDAPGPSLPAEAETKIPAAAAEKKAALVGSSRKSLPLIEKLITSTPSRMAASMASRMSPLKQPWV